MAYRFRTSSDNSTCSVLFVGGTSSVYINPVILVQGGIHEIALMLFRNSKKNGWRVITVFALLQIFSHGMTVKHLGTKLHFPASGRRVGEKKKKTSNNTCFSLAFDFFKLVI